MSASLFDLYIAETCPDEYAALREANARYHALAVSFLDGDATVSASPYTQVGPSRQQGMEPEAVEISR